MCHGAKLDNTYLPPPDAQSSGGDFGSGLAPPNQGNNNGNNGFNNGNNGNNNFGQPQNGFGQNPPQQQGGGGPGNFQPQESQQPPIAIISYDNEPNYGDGSYIVFCVCVCVIFFTAFQIHLFLSFSFR